VKSLFFSGGVSSLASQFHHLFPEFEGDNAIEMKEVPVPMIAVVGTGVSLSNFNRSCGAVTPLECRIDLYG
jgi:hypothetical protein